MAVTVTLPLKLRLVKLTELPDPHPTAATRPSVANPTSTRRLLWQRLIAKPPTTRNITIHGGTKRAVELFTTVKVATPVPLTDAGTEHVVLFASELETMQLNITFLLKLANRVT